MEKNAIKNFAMYARNKLRQSTIDMASIIGITEKGVEEPVSKGSNFEIYKSTIGAETILDDTKINQRKSLIKQINEKGFDQVVEEVAYTWFNRLIAIRFMEVNDYLPSRTRVLSSETEGRADSDLMTDPFNSGLDFSLAQKELILEYKENNNTDELFKLLFIAQCNELSKILPGLFEETDEYTELLFNIKYNDKEDVVYKLVNDISESNFNVEQEGQVEIIGWMYQFYNEEWKNQVNKEKQKIDKNNIPAVTQLFTPDWIVKYMVENSLGRFYLDGHPDSTIKTNWKYYLDEAEQEESVQKELEKIREEHKIPVEEIKLIDPCMGSGHILVYAFDVFMQMYVEEGWSEREASISILENNIYGLDIDKRAYQLSYFALMMKARQYNRRLFRNYVKVNLFELVDSSNINMELMGYLGDLKPLGMKLVNTFKDGKELGSIIKPEFTKEQIQQLDEKLDEILRMSSYGSLLAQAESDQIVYQLSTLLYQTKMLMNAYDITMANPPYMAPSPKQKPFVEKYYKDSKTDLFAVFIERCHELTKKNGYQSMITMHSWMFLSSFEKLREKLLINNTFINMAHLGARAFEEIGGEVVQTTAFVFENKWHKEYIGSYKHLIDYKSQDLKEEYYLKDTDLYTTNSSNFSKIPGSPIAYWILRNQEIFNLSKIADYFFSGGRNKTHNDEKYLRVYWEIDFFNEIWQPYAKGGEYRKWYGNYGYVVNWSNDAQNEYASHGGLCNKEYWYKKGLTWSLTSTKNCFRLKDEKSFYSSAAPTIFNEEYTYDYFALGLLNSVVSGWILSALNPTLSTTVGDVFKVPFAKIENKERIEELVKSASEFSKSDWDSYETSWDFTTHPMIKGESLVSNAYESWKTECNNRFIQLKANEEELNRIFIDIYGLQDELTPDVEDKDVTVHYVVDKKSDALFTSNYIRTREDEIKSLISYAVGCMFGRYSLDVDGLAYAGGEFDNSKYTSFIPDSDNIIPIREESYYEEDDIVDRFVEFIKVAYGESSLEENLKFIADSLSNKGETSREVIRNYFINDFFKDHCATYQVTGSGKRPIYWLFDSGKQNGFKALIYMHRYDENTVSNVRTDYLHKVQTIYEQGIKDDTYTIENATNKAEITKARKHRDKLEKQLAETRIYDQALAHIANERINIDLDDGVKVNYAKFQGVEVINEGSKKIKVDLLSKIK